jgi:hypothetical protein
MFDILRQSFNEIIIFKTKKVNFIRIIFKKMSPSDSLSDDKISLFWIIWSNISLIYFFG